MLHAELKVLEGRQSGKSIPLNVKQFLIGREQDCHLRPNSDLVSRHHCVLSIDDYTVRVRDLGSTNGTFVNGERIQGQVVLKPGDHLAVGKLTFELVVGDRARPAAPATVPVPEAVETSAGDSETLDIPATAAAETDDTTVLAGGAASDSAIMSNVPQPVQPAAVTYPQMVPYGMPQGYPVPGYPQAPYPAMPYGMPGYPAMPYAPPGYMPAPGYPMQPMMPGYPAGQVPGAAQAPATASELPVVLPNPDETGVKSAPPPETVPAAGAPSDVVQQGQKKPSEAAADIIRMHRLRRQ